jgi:AcrR family transcriptional regulator
MSMRLPAEQRRTQLLSVAIEVFGERGFHATSMDEVAEAAGVTKPVLYQHFPSKRALYRELLDEVDAQLVARLVDATAGAASGRERVEAGFAAYFRFVAENRAAFRLLFGASVRNDAEFAVVAERTIDRIAALVADLIEIEAPGGHRRVLAHAIVGMAEATSRRLTNDDAEDDPDRLAGWLAEMAWFGLRGVRAEEPVESRGLNT